MLPAILIRIAALGLQKLVQLSAGCAPGLLGLCRQLAGCRRAWGPLSTVCKQGCFLKTSKLSWCRDATQAWQHLSTANALQSSSHDGLAVKDKQLFDVSWCSAAILPPTAPAHCVSAIFAVSKPAV